MERLSELSISSTDPTPPFRFGSLPLEIRRMVLEKLLILGQDETLDHGRGAWASVSKEWQDFFERHNFKELCLKYSVANMHRLAATFQGQLSYRISFVGSIVFRVELKQYTCEECDKEEDAATITENNSLFSRAMGDLFAVLSTWSRNDASEPSIFLLLNINSPSDYQHYKPAMSNQYHKQIYLENHARIGQEPGDDRRLSLAGCQKRYIGTPLDFQISGTDNRLAEAPIIRGFGVPFDCRGISAGTFQAIFKSATRLLYASYIPYLGMDDEGRRVRNEASEALLAYLPRTVHCCSIFEAALTKGPKRSLKIHNEPFALHAVLASYRQRTFAIGNAISATSFFRAHRWLSEHPNQNEQPHHWPELQFLALMVDYWGLANNPTAVSSLLLEASRAAAHMPKLRLMEIWCDPRSGGASNGQAFFFQYCFRRNDLPATLTVSATFPAELSSAVSSSWAWVAEQRTRYGLRVNLQNIKPESLKDADVRKNYLKMPWWKCTP